MQKKIGEHVFTVRGDVISSTYSGDFTLAQAAQYLDLIETVLKEHPAYYAFGDVSRMGTLPAEARRLLVERHKSYRCAGAAVLGASTLLRSLILMTVRALTVLGRISTPVRFVKSEEEAQAWFDSLRAVAARN